MRDAFIATLAELAEEDERIVLITGDLGFTVLEPFIERFPRRFFNAGVAEQNMVGMATGLAEAGYTPYVYSIATFASMRAYEFVRNGPILHHLPVRIVGVGGGVDYGHNGMTHFAIEDVGIMRTQPGITIIAPADSAQTLSAVPVMQSRPGPVYLRLGKESQPVGGLDGRFRLGRVETLGDGEDVALISLGPMAAPAAEAAELLRERGINARVMVVSSLNPSPVDDLCRLLAITPLAVTAEAHYVNGGVGSMVAEVIAERGLGCRLIRGGIHEIPAGLTGGHAYMMDQLGLSAARLADAATQALVS
jgi:transketolase